MKKENKQHSMLNNLNMTSLKIFQLRSKSFLKFKKSNNHSNLLNRRLQLKIPHHKKMSKGFSVKVLQGDSA